MHRTELCTQLLATWDSAEVAGRNSTLQRSIAAAVICAFPRIVSCSAMPEITLPFILSACPCNTAARSLLLITHKPRAKDVRSPVFPTFRVVHPERLPTAGVPLLANPHPLPRCPSADRHVCMGCHLHDYPQTSPDADVPSAADVTAWVFAARSQAGLGNGLAATRFPSRGSETSTRQHRVAESRRGPALPATANTDPG